MKTKLFAIFSLIVVALTILSACGVMAPAATEAPAELPAPEMLFAGEPALSEEEAKGIAPMPTTVPYQTVPDVANVPGQAAGIDRLIIKNAEVSVLVEDSDIAIDRLTQVVGDVGGYIVSSQVWYQEYLGENYKYATITMGIPVQQFEVSLRRIRDLAIRVLDEKASGEDVTDQFVDLESRLRNLEATRDRIKTFLEDAKTVDEALRINQQLSDIEAQIEEVKGRMNYLSDRAAFSTITVTISPELPEIEPTPTPTPVPWTPGDTLNDATDTLVGAYQGLVEVAIWLFVVVVPVLAPFALIVWVIVRLVRGRPSRKIESEGK